MFHDHPRYDFIIVKFGDTDFFARLIFTFVCLIGTTQYSLALIQPFDAHVETRRGDQELHFHRVKAKPRSQAEFIPVRSIIHGTVLVTDFGQCNEYIVMDVVDPDLFLCMAEKVSLKPLVLFSAVCSCLLNWGLDSNVTGMVLESCSPIAPPMMYWHVSHVQHIHFVRR